MVGVSARPAGALPPNNWELCLSNSEAGGLGFMLGVAAWSIVDDWYAPLDLYPSAAGIFGAEYMQNGPNFPGDTGLYGSAYRTPILPGGNKTWWDIYMWAQNYTLVTPYRFQFHTGTGDYDLRPVGYSGHLVLDYVPDECAWAGPMDFWLDLSHGNNFTLPIITTSDPLQSTRFHLTVYDGPVPEPSSLLALALGAVSLAGAVVRRRRRE